MSFILMIYALDCDSFVVTWGRRGRDCMIVGFTVTYAISAYHH